MARPGQKFCATCGLPLLGSVQAPQPVPAPSPEPPAATAAPLPEATPHPRGTTAPLRHPGQGQPSGPSGARVALAATIAIVLLVIPAIVVLVLIFVAPSRPVTTTIEGQSTTPVPISPTLALDRAGQAFNSAQGLRYEAVASFFGVPQADPSITATQLSTITVSGLMQPPKNFTLDANIEQLGQYIVIGPDTWQRPNASTPWRKEASTDYSLGLVDPLSLIRYPHYYKEGSPQQVGSEMRDGVLFHRVHFDVDTELMAMDTQDPSLNNILSTSQVRVDIWVRDRDYQPGSMVISVEQQSGASVVLRATFTDFGRPVTISPPGGTQ